MGRPVRGSRESAFYTVDANPSLATLDSAFQLQEYIDLLVRLDPHDVQRIVALPGSRKEEQDEERPAVDEACWIYEQLRRLAQDLTHPLITTLQLECSRQTCPEMKAGEWLYLCVAHGNSGGMEHCCAIDYIVHTLDSATALLNSPRAFPSRIAIPTTSHRHFPSLARRLGRIFAHAYHHHRAAFETAEAEGALYARFLALARRFDLVPAEFLVIPPRASDPAPDPARITLLARGSPEASPRLGGRPRTDTMFLSDGFPRAASASPRRIPSPMAGTLFAEHAEEAVAQSEVPERARVYARDFALPQEGRRVLSGAEAPRAEAGMETEAEAETQAMREHAQEEYEDWEPEPPAAHRPLETVFEAQREETPPREPDAQDASALAPDDSPEDADDPATLGAAPSAPDAAADAPPAPDDAADAPPAAFPPSDAAPPPEADPARAPSPEAAAEPASAPPPAPAPAPVSAPLPDAEADADADAAPPPEPASAPPPLPEADPASDPAPPPAPASAPLPDADADADPASAPPPEPASAPLPAPEPASAPPPEAAATDPTVPAAADPDNDAETEEPADDKNTEDVAAPPEQASAPADDAA